jgi:hypothetical protein
MVIKLCGKSGKEVILDDGDYLLVKNRKWYLNSCGYAASVNHIKGCSRTDKKRNNNIAMHRLLMGKPPISGLWIDHINRNKLDNRRENLRWATPEESGRNQKAKEGLKGTRKDKTRWSARINGKHLGCFSTEREAALAYDKAARHFFREFAFLNFPEETYQKPVRYVDYTPEASIPWSRFVGVSYNNHEARRKKRWIAILKGKNLGYFLTELEAAKAYRRASHGSKG